MYIIFRLNFARLLYLSYLRMSKNRGRKMRKLRQIFEKLRQMAREMAKVAGFQRNREKGDKLRSRHFEVNTHGQQNLPSTQKWVKKDKLCNIILIRI